MCGLVGAAGNLIVNDEKVFKDLLYMDQLRGPHSTGIVVVNKVVPLKLIKEAVPAHLFLQLKPVQDAMAKLNNRVLIGHNRYATAGAINSINAHPFKVGDLYGVHNGTLRRQSLLPDHMDFDVDSENIYHSINKIGIDATVKRLYGSFALVWWDASDDTINMIRNDERELNYAVTNAGDLFWASEEFMLKAALARRNQAWTDTVLLAEDTLYKFKVNLETGAVSKPTARLLEAYSPPKVITPRTPVKRTIAGQSQSFWSKPFQDAGYKEASDLRFFIAEYDARSGVAIGASLDDHDIEVTITDVNAVTYRYLSNYTGFWTFDDCQSMQSVNGKPNKVVTKLVNLHENEWDDMVSGLSDEGVEEEPAEPTRPDQTGTHITESEFNRRFGQCAICTDQVFFNDEEAGLYSGDQAVCGNCHTDPSSQWMLNYMRP